MQLSDTKGRSFCTGSIPYRSGPAADGDILNKLFIEILIQGDRLEALVDTGGAYLILEPEVATEQELHPRESMESARLVIRGEAWNGFLYRIPVELSATRGENLKVELTAFVPVPEPGQQWTLPSFLGWHCCLERLRFAVDPVEERFYFGAG